MSTPIDLRYTYLSGGLFDGATPCTSCATGCTANGHTCANSAGQGGCAWWGCWQYDMDPPGAMVRTMIAAAKKATPPYVPMITYYEILQTSQASEGAGEIAATNDASVMTRYFADWRFLLQQIGNDVVLLHIEPDMWGYAEQQSSDPHKIASAVASANPTDCSAMENSIAGMGQCMVAMVRKYAPNAKVGLHASAWGTNMDVLLNTNASFNVAGEAEKSAAFLGSCGGSGADFVVVEASDRDAGYYQSMGRNTWWDEANLTLPDFAQDLAWVTALSQAMNQPAIDWQLPLGNANMNNTIDHWKDNRVDYLFSHMDQVAAAHIVGLAFGAGATGQTTPESDGGYFVAHVKAYEHAGGQPLCP
jgi:hypothetical protein